MKKSTIKTPTHNGSLMSLAVMAGAAIGVILLGYLSLLIFDGKTKTRQMQLIMPTQEKNSSYFLDHYVGYNGHYAHIPQTFCKADYDFYAECGINNDFMEIDLSKYQLPVQQITSAATDVNRFIVYTVADPESSNDCGKKAFLYDLKTSQTTEIELPADAWICGAIKTHIQSMSPGGRYVRFQATGPTSAYGSWLYDTKEKRIHTPSKHSWFHYFFFIDGPENGGSQDEYMIYEGGCENKNLVSMGDDCNGGGVFVQNNSTGKSKRITNFDQVTNYAGCYGRGARFEYHDGVLKVGSDCLGETLEINSFDLFIKSLD